MKVLGTALPLLLGVVMPLFLAPESAGAQECARCTVAQDCTPASSGGDHCNIFYVGGERYCSTGGATPCGGGYGGGDDDDPVEPNLGLVVPSQVSPAGTFVTNDVVDLVDRGLQVARCSGLVVAHLKSPRPPVADSRDTREIEKSQLHTPYPTDRVIILDAYGSLVPGS